MKLVDDLNRLVRNKSAIEILELVSSMKNENAVFSTSFGYEDQVITHMIFSQQLPIAIFTLDTGRLFPETYSVFNSTIDRYKKTIKVFYPNTSLVENLLTTKGPFSFYESINNRKECCFIRKVEPLKRALKGYTIWITGIRADQSGNRSDMPMVEWDESNDIIKIHPILNWDLKMVKDYIFENNIPYNPLHDKGFVSIGCQPCTRAIQLGEDFRAGRWWWEDTTKKECGLHLRN
ncbi:MAG: phosphoadenylyl-sulfate reductase [Bacteroidetes bacterium]|nr:phosphoadenylyl-sulfate reductase [Bacteroidota bacterium]MCA6444026.1 phosphoadenylyl-sulfate reductase [Bacteroidota bacterium]